MGSSKRISRGLKIRQELANVLFPRRNVRLIITQSRRSSRDREFKARHLKPTNDSWPNGQDVYPGERRSGVASTGALTRAERPWIFSSGPGETRSAICFVVMWRNCSILNELAGSGY